MTVSDWIDLRADPLPVDEARAWVAGPSCGATVLFSGTVRDQSDGRAGVVALEYEAYEEHALARMSQVANDVRTAHPDVAKMAILHRVGRLAVSDTAVVVAVSSPHRDAAFAAARMAIDLVKARVPIWKQEEWSEGHAWVEGCAAGTGP